MAAQGPDDWQGRLERDGEVAFGMGPWFPWLLCGFAVAAFIVVLAGALGRSAWQVVALVLLGGCTWYLANTAITGSNRLVVTRAGFAMGRDEAIAFDRLVAVSTARSKVTLYYSPGPDERMNVLERRDGYKRLMFELPRWGWVGADDLAVWLLRLKGGPLTAIDSRPGGRGFGRVHRIQDGPT